MRVRLTPAPITKILVMVSKIKISMALISQTTTARIQSLITTAVPSIP